MAELRRSSQDGTTLAELLVVIVLVGIIGTITTAGIVTSFRSQLTATQGAETLDELRLSVQRIRDVVRGADEVCGSSDGDTLVVWNDRDDAGNVGDDEDVEVAIFQVDAATNQLTGRLRSSATETLISDVIVTPGDVFTYDVDPATQPADLTCDDGATLGGGSANTARVSLAIEVQNADGENTVSTETTMQVRNAGLSDVTAGGGAGVANNPPTAAVNLPAQCNATEACQLEGIGTDPELGALAYAWDLDADGVYQNSSQQDPLVFFPTTGNVTVSLQVTDDQGQTATATGTIEILAENVNQAPVAGFTFECNGQTCFFDADSGAYANAAATGRAVSSDAEDGLGDLTYDWVFTDPNGVATTASGADQTDSFATSPTNVRLTVTDTEGESSSIATTVSTSTATIAVSSLTAVGGPEFGGPNNKSFTATLTVEVKTTTGLTQDGVQVTVEAANASSGTTFSCTTGTAGPGKCSIAVTARFNQTVTFTIDDVNGPPAVYDAGQNAADSIAVSINDTEVRP